MVSRRQDTVLRQACHARAVEWGCFPSKSSQARSHCGRADNIVPWQTSCQLPKRERLDAPHNCRQPNPFLHAFARRLAVCSIQSNTRGPLQAGFDEELSGLGHDHRDPLPSRRRYRHLGRAVRLILRLHCMPGSARTLWLTLGLLPYECMARAVRSQVFASDVRNPQVCSRHRVVKRTALRQWDGRLPPFDLLLQHHRWKCPDNPTEPQERAE